VARANLLWVITSIFTLAVELSHQQSTIDCKGEPMIDKNEFFNKLEARTTYKPIQRLNQIDWDKPLEGYKFSFPNEFKELIFRYGTMGLFNEYTIISPIDDPKEFKFLIDAVLLENRSGEYFGMFNTPEKKGFFGEHGYFPLGFHGSGGYLIWDSSLNPNSEPEILLFYSDAFEIVETHCTLLQFLNKYMDSHPE
jgi:hypothetical protein